MKKKIKIPVDFFRRLDIDIKLPKFKCKLCGKEILDTPSHWKYRPVENSHTK